MSRGKEDVAPAVEVPAVEVPAVEVPAVEVLAEVEPEAVESAALVSVKLNSPSRGHKRGDVIEVSAERAVELVAAGIAKRV